MNFLKGIAYWIYFNFVTAATKEVSFYDRLIAYGKAISAFIFSSFVFGAIMHWWVDNQYFTGGVIFIVFLNMALGGYVHWKILRDFDWMKLLMKTVQMIVVLFVVYSVLEIIISSAKPEFVVIGFRSAIQVATGFYPGAKALKNAHIFSNGEHPPHWVMEKIFNFERNGDLKAFLETKKNTVSASGRDDAPSDENYTPPRFEENDDNSSKFED